MGAFLGRPRTRRMRLRCCLGPATCARWSPGPWPSITKVWRSRLVVHNREDLGTQISTRVQVSASIVRSGWRRMCGLARHLARLLGVDYRRTSADLADATAGRRSSTSSPASMDRRCSAVISRSKCGMVRRSSCGRISKRSALDPEFGLALRSAQLTLFTALDDVRIGSEYMFRVDRWVLARKAPGRRGCVRGGRGSLCLGWAKIDRAREWLEHASLLVPPPPEEPGEPRHSLREQWRTSSRRAISGSTASS